MPKLAVMGNLNQELVEKLRIGLVASLEDGRLRKALELINIQEEGVNAAPPAEPTCGGSSLPGASGASAARSSAQTAEDCRSKLRQSLACALENGSLSAALQKVAVPPASRAEPDCLSKLRLSLVTALEDGSLGKALEGVAADRANVVEGSGEANTAFCRSFEKKEEPCGESRSAAKLELLAEGSVGLAVMEPQEKTHDGLLRRLIRLTCGVLSGRNQR